MDRKQARLPLHSNFAVFRKNFPPRQDSAPVQVILLTQKDSAYWQESVPMQETESVTLVLGPKTAPTQAAVPAQITSLTLAKTVLTRVEWQELSPRQVMRSIPLKVAPSQDSDSRQRTL